MAVSGNVAYLTTMEALVLNSRSVSLVHDHLVTGTSRMGNNLWRGDALLLLLWRRLETGSWVHGYWWVGQKGMGRSW